MLIKYKKVMLGNAETMRVFKIDFSFLGFEVYGNGELPAKNRPYFFTGFFRVFGKVIWKT